MPIPHIARNDSKHFLTPNPNDSSLQNDEVAEDRVMLRKSAH